MKKVAILILLSVILFPVLLNADVQSRRVEVKLFIEIGETQLEAYAKVMNAVSEYAQQCNYGHYQILNVEYHETDPGSACHMLVEFRHQ